MRRYRLYIETSTWNFLITDQSPEKRRATRKFFARAKIERYELFVSAVVIKELGATKDPDLRRRLLRLIVDVSPTEVGVTQEVLQLAERYVLQGTIPKRYVDDAIHVAAAVVNRMDAIVSWNCEHLVKLRTRREVNALSRLNGYGDVEIVTPEEVA